MYAQIFENLRNCIYKLKNLWYHKYKSQINNCIFVFNKADSAYLQGGEAGGRL